MPSFTSQYVGGPACGQEVTTNRAPRAEETLIFTAENGHQHLYVWRCFQWLPPAWRYVAPLVMSKGARK